MLWAQCLSHLPAREKVKTHDSSITEMPWIDILKRIMVTLACGLMTIKVATEPKKPKTTANISHSMLAYLVSSGANLMDMYASGLFLPSESFWMGTALCSLLNALLLILLVWKG